MQFREEAGKAAILPIGGEEGAGAQDDGARFGLSAAGSGRRRSAFRVRV